MRISCAVMAVILLVGPAEALAQRLTLQTPALARFVVRSNVSVPDRGSALLGSVSRAADGTRSFGPVPSGSSRGRSISHRSVRSSVYIHDFAAMDPFLRDRSRSAPPPDPVVERRERQARAASAYAKLAARARRKGKTKLAERYEQLAREYEEKTRLADRASKR